jgi:hypothetical protein
MMRLHARNQRRVILRLIRGAGSLGGMSAGRGWTLRRDCAIVWVVRHRMRRVSLIRGLMTSSSINVVDAYDDGVLYDIDIPLEAMQSTDNGYQQPSHQGASTGADTMDSCPSFYNSHNIQGKILWLPAREELPYRAVKTVRPRADKGRVDRGVYSHPVVVISRPYDEDNIVHFHPVGIPSEVEPWHTANPYQITTFQGRRVEQVYDKQSPHHISTRGWYLPVAPSPQHIDHDPTRKSRDLPTLELGSGATLRAASYVNVRNVYSIDMTLLQPYCNANTPDRRLFRFTRTSMHEMLKRGKFVHQYVPGRQFADLEPIPATRDIDQRAQRDDREPLIVVGVMPARAVPGKAPPSTDSNRANNDGGDREPLIAVGVLPSTVAPTSTRMQEDFRMLNTDGEERTGQRPKEPPDNTRSPIMMSVRPMGYFLEGFESVATITHRRLMALSYDPNAIKRPLDRAWRDFKGVTAIAIASI